jgi:hypothetical protein
MKEHKTVTKEVVSCSSGALNQREGTDRLAIAKNQEV